jgi:antitoxin (DNA-binding transcriptional repressor) of toxin-antitoxin stability system
MKHRSIHALHDQTERPVREAVAGNDEEVTDRGRRIATLVPLATLENRVTFASRPVLPAWALMQALQVGGDSTEAVSADRDGR